MGEMDRQEVHGASGLARSSCMGLALFYIAGPLIIMAELLKPPCWIPVFILFPAWLAEFDAFLFRNARASGVVPGPALRRSPEPLRVGASVAVFLLGAFWIYCSGIGGFTFCRWDYVKHNLVFASLLSGHLPIKWDSGDGNSTFIHYYFAYYIIPVRIYQGLQILIGSLRFDHVLFPIYCLVLFVALRVMSASQKLPAAALLALLALTGGLDVVGQALLGAGPRIVGQIPGLGVPVFSELDWWGVPKAPQSVTMSLFFAPQHFFAALIGAALLSFIFGLERPAGAKLLHGSAIIVASTLWSPYVAVGLAAVSLPAVPGLLRDAVAGWRGEARRARKITLRFPLASAFVVLLLVFAVLFYSASLATSPPTLIFPHQSLGPWALSFLLRQAPSIAALAALAVDRVRFRLRPAEENSRNSGHALLAGFAFLLSADAVLLCFQHGTYDDWALRTTLPVSILLAVALCRFLADWPGRTAKIVVILLLAASSLSSVNEIAQSLFLPRQCAPYGAFSWQDMGSLASQYEGRSDSLLYRWLARQR